MRSLVFKNTLVMGGGETYSVFLCRILLELGYDVFLYTNHYPLIDKVKDSDIDSNMVDFGSEPTSIRGIIAFFLFYPIGYIKMRKILNSGYGGDGDVVFFQGLQEKIIGTKMAKRMGYKVIWVEHLSLSSWINRIDKFLIKRWYIKLSDVCDRIVTISDFLKDEIADYGVKEEKINTVYFGLSNTPQKIAKRGDHEKDIVFVGRLNKEKGVDLLIRSFSGMVGDYDSNLLIVGDGDDRKRLEDLVHSIGSGNRIKFFGFSDSVIDYLKRSYILVLPSVVPETLGIVLLEAMATGVIVVASNIGGIPEVVKDGYNGFLFEAGNEKDLDRVIRKIFTMNDSSREIIRSNALAVINKNFSYQSMKISIDKIIKQ